MPRPPKNLIEAIFPFVTIYGIVGHGIFRSSSGQQRPIFSVIYAAILMSLYFTALYYASVYAFSQPWYGDYEKILLLVVFITMGLFIFGLILSWYHAKTSARITEQLAKVDETLLELGANFNYTKTRNEGYAMILIWTIFTVGFTWFDVLWLLEAKPIFRIYLMFSVFHYPTHIITLVVTIFSMKIRHVHLELGSIKELMCETHGMQLTLNISALFVMLTGFPYLLYIMAMNSIVSGQDLRMVVLGVWISIYFVFFVLNNEVCENVCSEIHRTGQIIHCLCQATNDSELVNEIKQFSLQLINDPLEFKPAGCITLNHRFVLNFAKTVSTYLVILIQMTPSKPGTARS